MAKRYISFKEIPLGNFKPQGTMGSHHCTIISQGEVKVVIGSVTGRVTLKLGDTLGYDCGNVWLVPQPDSYKDPIRRVLAQKKISQKVLQYSTKPVRFLESWQTDFPRGSSADSFTGEEVEIFKGSDVLEECNTGKRIEEFNDGFLREVTGGEAIIVKKVVGRETTTHRPRRIVSVVVRPSANKADVAKWLLSHI